MPAKEAWGLDIGQCAIRMVKLQRQGEAVRLVDYAVAPLQSFPDDPDYDEKVLGTLVGLIQEKNIGRTPVYVSLSGFSTLFRDFTLPATVGSKMEEIVSYEARQHIPYPLEEVIWDYHEYKDDPDSTEVQISLVCCRRDIVEGLLGLLEQIDVQVAGIQVGPLALLNYLLFDQEVEDVQLILDVGARSTDFLILNEGTFWLRSISIGGNDVSQALMDKFNLSFADAEALKAKLGPGEQSERAFKVIAPVLNTLNGEVQRSLGYYKSLNRGVRVEAASAGGGTFRLRGASKFRSSQLVLPINRIQSLGNIIPDGSVDSESLESELQAMGVALGLALQGVGHGSVETNLLPPEILKIRKINRKVPMALASVLVLVLLTVFSLIAAVTSSSTYDEINDSMQRTEGLVDEKVQELAETESQFGPAKEKNIKLSRIAAARDQVRLYSDVFMKLISDINRQRRERNLASSEARKAAEIMYRTFVNTGTLGGGERTGGGRGGIGGMDGAGGAMMPSAAENPELHQTVKDICAQAAEYLVSRKHQIVVEDMKVELVRENWYQETTGEGEEGTGLISPEVLEDHNQKTAAAAGGGGGGMGMGGMGGGGFPGGFGGETVAPAEEDASADMAGEDSGEISFESLEAVPVDIVKVVIRGFTVSRRTEVRDFVSLKTEFEKIKGVYHCPYETNFSRQFNSIPVLIPRLTTMTLGNRSSNQNTNVNLPGAVKITPVMETFPEPILAFRYTIKFLPRNRKIKKASVKKAGETNENTPEGEAPAFGG